MNFIRESERRSATGIAAARWRRYAGVASACRTALRPEALAR
jgi:hypothetical protein